VPVAPKHRDEVIVRRVQEDLRIIQGGFPTRTVVQIAIDGLPADAPELTLSTLLDQYRALREERLQHTTKRTQAAVEAVAAGADLVLFGSTLTSAQRGEKRATQSTSAAWAEASRASDCSRITKPGQLSASVFVIPISSPSFPAVALMAITRTNGGDPSITATALSPSSGSTRTAAWQEKFGMCTQPNSMTTPSGKTEGRSRSSHGLEQTLQACGLGRVQPQHRVQ